MHNLNNVIFIILIFKKVIDLNNEIIGKEGNYIINF